MSDSGISARKRLQGLSLALVLPLVGSRAMPRSDTNEAAGTPVPDDGGVTLEPLARMGGLPALPADGSAILERITWAPGAWLNLPAAGPVAYFVERGALDVRIPDDIAGRVVLSGGRDRFATARGGFTRVLVGGTVYAPDGGLEVTRNPGAMPTVALVVRVNPYHDSGVAVATATATGESRGERRRRGHSRLVAEHQASVESLADLPFAPGLEPNVRVTLDRITYPPGAIHVFDYAGPTLLTVEQGEVDLLYQPGQPPGVGFSGLGGGRLPTTRDGFVRLPAGASVSARDGHLGMTRNAGDAPASLLVAYLDLDADADGMSDGSHMEVGRRDARRRRQRPHSEDTSYATISPGGNGRPFWTDLTETGPLPAIPAGATAGLRRITLAPGGTLDIGYLGPTLYYVEQGTLVVDAEHRQLRFVEVNDVGGGEGRSIGRHGEVPAGVGVYAADGNLGPARNGGEDDLVILALLIVPQPGGTTSKDGGGFAMAAATPHGEDDPVRETRDRKRGTPTPPR